MRRGCASFLSRQVPRAPSALRSHRDYRPPIQVESPGQQP